MIRFVVGILVFILPTYLSASHVDILDEYQVEPTADASFTSLYVKENTIDISSGGCIWIFGDPQVPSHCRTTYELLPDTFFTQDNGGHNHDDSNKPLGSFKVNGVEADVYEYFDFSDSSHTVTYTAAPFSGDVILKSTHCTNEDFWNPCFNEYRLIHVKITGLVSLPASTNYNLIGVTTIHPGSHHANASMMTFIERLSTEWAESHAILQINDISLKYGGHFDLNGNWTASDGHKQHFFGNDVDIHYVGATNERRFAALVRRLGDVRYQVVHNNHHHISLNR